MPEKIVKFYRGEVKGVDEEKKTLTAIVSTKAEDRDGDVIEPESFREMLKHYKKHPVLLADHDYFDLRKQIGIAKTIEINDKDVQMTFEYLHGMGNDEADWAWELAKRGLASFSIGFIGHDWEALEKTAEDGSKYISGRKFTKIELLEVSQVLIPSNRGALQASADLCEIAIKSFKPEDFPKGVQKEKEPEKTKAPEVDGAQGEVNPPTIPEPTKAHYTEEVLGKGDDKSVPMPDKATIDEAVKSTVTKILKGE